jgi:hypothetical protein
LAVNEIHGNPQLTVVLAAIMNADDMRVPQGRRKVSLAAEP